MVTIFMYSKGTWVEGGSSCLVFVPISLNYLTSNWKWLNEIFFFSLFPSISVEINWIRTWHWACWRNNSNKASSRGSTSSRVSLFKECCGYNGWRSHRGLEESGWGQSLCSLLSLTSKEKYQNPRLALRMDENG